MIHAVSFDLWDTLIVDDSDEPRRAALGLAPKAQARETLFVEAVGRANPGRPETEIRAAWQAGLDRFRHAWKVERRTPTVSARVRDAVQAAGLAPPEELAALVEKLEMMEVEIPPEPAPGARACLEALRQRYRLAVISDAIVTPGRGLRRILARHGLIEAFDILVFSDEAGAAKPDPAVFRRAAASLQIRPEELVHVGDRESNDIEGPRSFGARAVLYTGVVDRHAGDTQADAVCRNLAELPAIIAGLNGTDR